MEDERLVKRAFKMISMRNGGREWPSRTRIEEVIEKRGIKWEEAKTIVYIEKIGEINGKVHPEKEKEAQITISFTSKAKKLKCES